MKLLFFRLTSTDQKSSFKTLELVLQLIIFKV